LWAQVSRVACSLSHAGKGRPFGVKPDQIRQTAPQSDTLQLITEFSTAVYADMPGGRPKGSRNKTGAAWLKRVAQGKKSPAEFLLDVMDGKARFLRETQVVGVDEDGNDIKERIFSRKEVIGLQLEAAKVCLPYCHPKLQNVDIRQLGAADEASDGDERLSSADRLTEELYQRAKGANITPIGKNGSVLPAPLPPKSS
jgi:hypothetical protein